MMYEKYVRQALPDREYRELLGSAVCVFNSNNAFIINNILKDPNVQTNWYQLIDKESGEIKTFLQKRLKNEGKLGEEILALFEDVVNMRNRIIHSFRITDENDNQILATKEKESKGGRQFRITEDYLYDFIKINEDLILLYFSGIGGFELGIKNTAEELGMTAECVGFSEIGKFTISVYQRHFPNTKDYYDIKYINTNKSSRRKLGYCFFSK